MTEKKVVLKAGKDKAIKNRHHWIFSGAIAHLPKCTPGELLPVYAADDAFLGYGYFNPKSNITGRMLSFDTTTAQTALVKALNQALKWRMSFFDDTTTNGYRLVNGEGDALPGLIIDRYADTCVIQIGTQGMEQLKPLIIDWLINTVQVKSIYEKSTSSSRKEEGLSEQQKWLFGTSTQEIKIIEEGLTFFVDIVEGQKTGFFFDQRQMRRQIRSLSHGKTVLNCFGYTGGFSVYALKGNALHADTVDISKKAIETARRNVAENGFNVESNGFFTADVFNFLKEAPLDYDIVILDPPAFAKRQKDVIQACRGYKEINRLAIQKMKKGSILLSCSCSYYIDEKLFQQVLFQAANEAKRTVKIIGTHRLAEDHPVNIFHPESSYLKSFLLYIGE